jgi:hypothetical protein
MCFVQSFSDMFWLLRLYSTVSSFCARSSFLYVIVLCGRDCDFFTRTLICVCERLQKHL